MKAVVWHAKRKVAVEDVPDPIIQDDQDAIIRVTSTAICGSDLHLYEVMEPFMEQGDILGHESMGIVQEVGRGVTALKPGDRVVVPFNIACGTCFMCKQGLQTQCETTQVKEHNRGAALFGYTKLYGHIPGAQAEYLRVPFANYTSVKVPEGPPDERFLFLSDVLPTAWQAVQYANVPKGGTLAILGLGPIGDMSVRVARHFGVEKIIGIDLVPERLERVRALGADVIDVRGHEDDLVDMIRDKTNGRGADSVIDAVGLEAHGSPTAKAMQTAASFLPDEVAQKLFMSSGVDRLHALYSAINIVRRGGTISLSGVYAGHADPISMDTLFDKQIQLRMGQANVRRWTDEILKLLIDRDAFSVESFASHRLPLKEAPEAYEKFQKKEDGFVKVVLEP